MQRLTRHTVPLKGLAAILLLLALRAQAVPGSRDTALSVRIDTPVLLPTPPDDSLDIPGGDVPETIQTPQLNAPRNPIFKECAYCTRERLEWYYDFEKFKSALQLCGADYVRLRFDRLYSGQGVTNRVAFFFSLKGDILLFDSLTIDLQAGTTHLTTSITENIFLNMTDDLSSSLAAQIRLAVAKSPSPFTPALSLATRQDETEQTRLLHAATTARIIHDSFSSRMNISRSHEGLHSTVHFSVADRRFTLQTLLDDTLKSVTLDQGRGTAVYPLQQSRTRGAYAIGYYRDAPLARQSSPHSDPPPLIVDYWISRVRWGGYAMLHIEVSSAAGLKKLVMPGDRTWTTIPLAGAKTYTHSSYVKVIGGDCIILSAFVEDVNGMVVGSKPHWVVDDSYGGHVKEPFSKYWHDCPGCH